MFLTRLISGFVLTVILLIFNYLGGVPLWLLMGFLSCVGLYEFYKATGILTKKGLAVTGFIFTVVYATSLLFESYLSVDPKLPIIILFMIIDFIIYVFGFPKYDAKDLFASTFGMVYVVVALMFVYLTRGVENGRWVIWLIYVASWGSDTSAYCVGMLCNKFFGTHKLAPVLSPHKSIEGAIGGVVGAALIGAIYGFAFSKIKGADPCVIIFFALIGAIGSVISQIGDLTASGIKRNYDIKDYGKLIPGHGGVLDRFDSVIITAPIIYFLASIML